MSNLWGYILSSTIYGSITGVVILIIKKLLENRINKKYTHLLWMILIIKLIMPFGPESHISLFNKIPVKINQFSSISEISTFDGERNYYEGSISENLSQEENMISENYNSNISFDRNEDSIDTFSKIIPIIWISGVVISLITYATIYLYFIRNIRKKEKIVYIHLERFLDTCKEKLNIKRKIHIVIDDTINSPSLIGIFKTRIILPSNLINLSEEELKHIFLHELCHYKSKDIIVDNILIFLQCVHWFNPLIMYLFKQIRNDMEMACDERVLSILNKKYHNEYGLTMLTVLEKANFNKRFSIGLNMADDKNTIKKRVELIKNSKYFSSKKKIFTITGMVCLIIMGGILLTSRIPLDDKNNGNFEYDQISSDNLDDAISEVIIENYLDVLEGEFPVESHEILGKKADENFIEVYIMSTYGIYEFQNDVFNLTTGVSNIPMKIKFSKNKDKENLKNNIKYRCLDSKTAEDGALFEDSLYEMFPKREALQALNNSMNENFSKRLLEDINKQAKSYVESLGRESEVTYSYAPKEELSDEILSAMSGNEELYKFPQYIGNREVLENGKRYIYETEYDEKTGILSFYKYKSDKEKSDIIQYKFSENNIKKLENNDFY